MSEHFQSGKNPQQIRALFESYLTTKGTLIKIPRGAIPGEMTIKEELEATEEKETESQDIVEAKPDQS